MMKHWIERVADELNERDVDKHVIASGWKSFARTWQ